MSNFSKPKIVKSILAIVVVFLMSAGAFIGAAENGSNSSESEVVEALIPDISVAEETFGDLEESTYDIEGIEPVEPGLSESGLDVVEPIVPSIDPEGNSESIPDVLYNMDGTLLESKPMEQAIVPDIVSYGSSKNTLSDAMSYITETKDEPEEPESTSETDVTVTSDGTTTRSRAGSLNMIIGTHNTQYAGVGHGYLYRSSSTYYAYDNYAMYNYQSGTTTEYHGFGVYDLRDLAKYTGVKITSGQIVYQQDYRYYAASQDFWTMKSIPNDGASGSLAQGWFNEVGGTGSVKLASETFGSASNMNNFRHTLPITSGGITEINNRLSSNNYDFTIGGDITSFWTGYTYGYIYCLDVRLYLNFTYTDMPMDSPNQVAVGDELSGYAYSSTMYDIGRMYTYYGGFAVWNASVIKSLLPTKGPEGEPIELTGISVQVNCVYGYYQYFSIYDMTYDPRDYISSPNTVYTDATSGTRYFNYDKAGTYVSTAREFRWDLNAAALEDFNETLDGDPDFFALGFTQTVNYMYLYSPMLIVKWRIVYPPTKTIQLGADNPEKDGHAMGYVRQSGSSYYCYANYYSYPYYYVSGSTIYDYHGFAEFDLKDLTRWPGVKVKKVSLVVHNYNMYYFDTVNFTAMKTAPYEGAPTSVLASAFTESGSGGTIIGGYQLTTGTDSTYRTIEVELNKAAATAVNNTLSGSPKYYSFGVGMFVQSLQSGRTSGYARWNDVRLKVTFEYKDDMDPTTKGEGIAFGDDWSGRVYKYTAASTQPYGYIYTYKSTSEYRGYSTWDIDKIARVFPEENFSRLEIKKVGVRFNHYSGNPSAINIYHMKYNASDSSVTDDNLFDDCGDGTKYFGPSTGISVSDTEIEWDLGKDAVKDFQDAFEDSDPTFFGIGWAKTSTASSYEHSPKLVLEWTIPPPGVKVELYDETPEGYEMSPLFFDASPSKNVSGGNGALRFEWDWDNDGKFDEVSTSPYAQQTWPDGPYATNITLRVNDTDTDKNASREFMVMVLNANPMVNTTKGEIGPQPVYEAENCSFKGFTVEDPAGVNDTYWYFWDFDGDLVYDVNGSCDNFKIPEQEWYYDDDFQGEASLLVLDEDGGSTNLTFPKHYDAVPPTTYGTGYVYSDSQSYYVYYGNPTVEWQYSDDYRRGWAKFELSGMEQGAVIDKVVFKGTISQDTNVDLVGVHYMDTDPIPYVGGYSQDVWDEAEDGPKIFEIEWSVGSVKEDITDIVKSPAGQELLQELMKRGSVIFGFDYEKPDPSFAINEGYLDGYSFGEPILSIDYHLTAPRYLFPIVVKNRAPVINCSSIKISPAIINEGDNVTITNLSFCDKGNDTYEYNISLGDTYWTGWQSLGEWPVPGAGGPCTMMDVGDQATTYSGMTRGYWFQAPCNFVICGVRVPTDASTGSQSAAVLRMKDNPNTWIFSATTNNFDQLGYWKDVSGTEMIKTNIQVKKDDWITILGCRSSSSINSYGSALYKTKIGTYDVTLTRAGFQYNLYNTAPQNIWTEINYQIGRVEMYYQLGGGGAPFTGDNLALDAVASHSGGGSGIWGPDRLNNGDKIGTYNDCWTTGTSPNNWVQLDWSKPVTIGSMIIYYTRWRNLAATYCLHTCDIQWWDGSSWQSDQKYDDGKYGTNNDHYIVMKQPRTTTRLRLYNIWSGSNVMIQEWEVFGGSGGSIEGWGAYGPGCFNVTTALNFTVPDDYPKMGTIEDELNITVWVRDDDDNTFVPGRGIGYLEEPAMVDSGYVYYNNGRKVVVDSDNNIYVVYQKYITTPSTQYQIYVAKSKDNGLNWEPHLVTNQWYFTYYSYYPSITIDSNDVLHVAWSGGTSVSTTYNIRYANSKDGGITWGDHYNITEATSYYHYYPSITCDNDDKIHIAWYGMDNSTYYYNVHYINRSVEGFWGPRVMVTTWPYSSPYMSTNRVSVETDSKGNVHIAWMGYIETTKMAYNIGYKVHWAANDTWSNIIPLTSETGYYKYYPVITIDENDDIHVIWYGTSALNSGSNAMYRMYDSSKESWGPIELISNSTYQYDTTIGFNQKGEVNALWYGYRLPSLTTPYVIHHAQKSTTGWTGNYNLVSIGTYNYYPNLMCSPPNSVAEEGFAFVWYDGGSVRYWTSRDFRMGNPEYLNGKDWCNGSVLVKNVEPKINLTAMGVMARVNEQEEVGFKIFFDDPGLLATTEIYETRIDWGDGTVDDWTVYQQKPVEALLMGRNPESGDATELLRGEHSFKDKPITYLKFQYFQPLYTNYWYINLEGYNMSTNAWEQLYYHYDIYAPSGPYEQTWKTPYYIRWRVECQCYNYEQYTGYYEYEFMVEDFNLTGGYLEAIHKYRDDMPTATPWDFYDIFIELREDDLGYDNASYILNVSSVAPTLEGGTLFTISSSPWAPGKFDSALKLDGIDDYVDCGNDDSLDITDDITILAWIRPDIAGETGLYYQMSPISKAEEGTTWSWQIRYNAPGGGNYLGFQCNDITAGSTWVTVKQDLTPGKWYHIAAKFDKSASMMSMYLDGVLTDSTSLSGIKSGTSKLFIGYDGWPGNYFDGNIDDVAIFDRPLSTIEIQKYMNTGVGGGTSLPSGLAGYWNFDEGSGIIAHDTSSNKNHGTIFGLTAEVTEEYLTEYGIDEGSSIAFEGFTYDDVAIEEPTETFEYQVDWGDGEVTPWMDDFRSTEDITGAGVGSSGEELYTVVPNAYEDSISGVSQNTIPWGPGFGTRRFMNWYGGSEFHGQAYNINSIGFRYRYSTGLFSITYNNIKIYMSHTTATTLSTTFANNYGFDRTLVLDQSSFTWTKTSIAPQYRDDFTMIPFDKPFKYDGKSNIVFEVSYTTGSPMSSYYFDSAYDASLHRLWASSPTATTGSTTTGYGLIARFAGGVGGEVVEPDVSCSATEYTNGRKLVMDGKDNMYVVYKNGSSPSWIQVSASDNLGESWNPYKVTTDTASRGQDQLEPSLAVDSKDVLHAVWRGRTNSNSQYNIRYANSADGGKTWANFKMVTAGTESSELHRAPSIAVDSKDTLHITWFGSSAANSAKYNIYYINRTSTGTWSSMSMLTEDTTDMYHQYPTIAVDTKDDLHVTWSGQTSSMVVNNIQYRKFDSSTGTWGSIEMLTSSSTNNNLNPSIAVNMNELSEWYGKNVNAKDSIHVVWSAEPSPTQIKHIKWDANTNSWGSVEDISDNGYNNFNPTVGLDKRGYVYIVWSKDDFPAINMSAFDGYNWVGELRISGDMAKAAHPNIMYGGGNSIVARGVALVFTGDENGTGCKLYFSTSSDFNLTDLGPWQGVPRFQHLYRDDNPSATMQDICNLRIRVRDDDLAVGEYVIPVLVHNVWPTLEKGELELVLNGDENAFYTPEIKFVDPGTGPAETWGYWLDVDDSESFTEHDLTGSVTTTTVMNDITYGTIQPIKTPFNDEYMGTIGLYLYDDDIESSELYVNISYPIMADGNVYTVKSGAVSSSTAYWNGLNLVMDSAGTFYAVYYDQPTPYQIYCSVSYDMGVTWARYQVTSDSASSGYYQYYPSVAIDSKDVLHAVWYGLASGYSSYYNIRYANSKDGGKTWGSHTMVTKGTSSPNYHYAPSIAVDSKDTVHIAWYGYSYLTNSNPYNIHYINRTSAGTWSSITMVTSYTSSRYQYYPSIAIDTQDNVHVAWSGYTPWVTYYNIQYRKMDANTGKWGPLVLITNFSSEYNYYPSIVTDQNDNVHIAWFGYPSPYKIYYINYTASTSSWGSRETVFSDGNYHYYPSISVDQRGYVYIAWMGGSPYMIMLSKKTSPTGSWETPLIVTSDPLFSSSQYYPSLLGHGPNCYPLQGAAMVWSGYTGSAYDLMFYSTDDLWLGETYEHTIYKVKFDVTVNNVEPNIVMPDKVEFLPDETVKLPIHLSDQGSDDLYFTIDWGDFSSGPGPLEMHKWYNNDKWPEPGYDVLTGKIHSALNGTAPFVVDPELYHKYNIPGKFMINMTIWDDDEWNWGMEGHNFSLPVEVLSPYRIKEVVVRELEKLLPGRLGYIGYDTLKLRYVGEIDPTLLVYNHISRPPYFWETELIMSVCNVMPNSTIFINASFIDEGHFGDKLILKLYNESCGVIDVAEIPTVYTCLEPLKINQRYGDYVVEAFTLKEGMIYHHYSQFAVKTEDALDHVLRSINRDPRRGYGWWHQYWAWWCGYTFYRDLWVDEMRVDPQFGQVVFCEERAAVLDLMEVLKNCLDPKGVYELTMKYTGGSYGCSKVDVEIYFLSDFWWGGWKWYDAAYDLMLGESFTINAANLSSGKLPDRVMFRIYHATTGKLLDTIYIRTSGEWFLEVEPGNMYGDFTITDSTLIVGNDTEWDDWWGGDADWWDYFFGFWYWEQEEYRSGCGWIVEGCFNEDEARVEQTRICTNLTIIKQLINMLVRADDMLSRIAYFDAENMTVQNASYEDEYMYHYKWSKRYWYRGYDSYKKGRPHRAISDFKVAWRHAILATKYSILNPTDPTPGSEMHDPCGDCPKGPTACGLEECEHVVETPWWMHWYFSWCTCMSNCASHKEHCGCGCYC